MDQVRFLTLGLSSIEAVLTSPAVSVESIRLVRVVGMQLSPQGFASVAALLGVVGLHVEFLYKRRKRVGTVETIGEGPQGAFLTMETADGYKSFSIPRIRRMRIVRS